jgi:hypothetical protein
MSGSEPLTTTHPMGAQMVPIEIGEYWYNELEPLTG